MDVYEYAKNTVCRILDEMIYDVGCFYYIYLHYSSNLDFGMRCNG